jgi:hypothetical protein
MSLISTRSILLDSTFKYILQVRRGQPLLAAIVGDSLLEPFWPEGEISKKIYLIEDNTKIPHCKKTHFKK